jgi:methionyl-tRNA formyltransferase
MTEKADAGDIVAQTAVPILPDDTAKEVFDKVTVAAEVALDGVLPALISGTAPRRAQDLSAGRYSAVAGARRHHRLEPSREGHPQSRCARLPLRIPAR